MSTALLDVDGLKVHFRTPNPAALFGQLTLKAVDGISFSLNAGETLGIVGESGCGKSTLARGILGLVPVTAGRVVLLGRELTALRRGELRRQRKNAQIIFQDPLASLNPRMTVGDIIAEPLRTFNSELAKAAVETRVRDMLETVGLQSTHFNRYPHEFSGGQCQRIGIARALISEPKLIICDEPVSALDVSVQAQVINLLMDLQRDRDLALIFIAHDLAVVRKICHRVIVMYLGRAVETASREALYDSPRHPYTRALLAAVPKPDPRTEKTKRAAAIRGDLPSPLAPPSGCAFRTRCPHAEKICEDTVPQLEPFHEGLVACHKAALI